MRWPWHKKPSETAPAPVHPGVGVPNLQNPFQPCLNCRERPILLGHPWCHRCDTYQRHHDGRPWTRTAKGVKVTHWTRRPNGTVPPAAPPPAPVATQRTPEKLREWGQKGAAIKKAKAAQRHITFLRNRETAGGRREHLVAAAVSAGAETPASIGDLMRLEVPGLTRSAVGIAIWRAEKRGLIRRTADNTYQEVTS